MSDRAYSQFRTFRVFVCIVVFLFSVTGAFCEELSFDSLSNVPADIEDSNGVSSEGNCDIEPAYTSEVDFQLKAIHYRTSLVDIVLHAKGGTFNGQDFSWKDGHSFIGLFVNSHNSTVGSYGTEGAPFLAITDKNNIFSITSITTKSVVRFFTDRIEVKKKARPWVLIIPFPSSQTNETIFINSARAIEEPLLDVLSNLINDEKIKLAFAMVGFRRARESSEIAYAVDTDNFDFDKSFERLVAKGRRVSNNSSRDKMIVAFYKFSSVKLDAKQVVRLAGRVYQNGTRDYILYNWGTTQHPEFEDLERVANRIYSNTIRDALIAEYVEQRMNGGSSEPLSADLFVKLTHRIYQNSVRDQLFYKWGISQDLTAEDFLKLTGRMYSNKTRDKLILEYLEANYGDMTYEQIESLRSRCYSNSVRDEIVVRFE